MKKVALFLLCILAFLSSEARVVKGSVTCGGKGVPSVAVSDGFSVTLTDSKGRYSLEITPDSRHIFVSTPSGYTSPFEGGVVKFFLPITESKKYDFTLTRKEQDDTDHRVMLIADPQVQDADEYPFLEQNLAQLAEDAFSTDMDTFGICLGDIIGVDHSFYPRHNAIVEKAGVPFRYVQGNHDMTIWKRSFEMSFEKYGNTYGPSWYSFNVGKVHYVVLDDCFYIGRDWYYLGYLPESQLRWLEKDLAVIDSDMAVVACLHIPSTLGKDDRERFTMANAGATLANKNALYDMLKPYKAMILSGHIHTACNQVINENLIEMNIPSLAGAWWCGPVCGDGTPAGYKVLEVSGTDFKWQYRCCNEERERQMKVYADSPIYEGKAVANIWDWDEAWTVSCKVDGKQMKVKRVFNKDPFASLLYDGRKMKREWVKAGKTHHIFTADLPEGAQSVEFTATDRFGRTYSEAITLNKKISTPIIYKEYAADDSRIRYIGRHEAKDGKVSFDWTGNTVKIRFIGSTLALRMSDTKANYFNLWIDREQDNRADKVIRTSGDTLMVLASGLGEGAHDVVLQKRTEAEQGCVTISAVLTDGELMSAAPAKARRIEFIGDSYTCGYGTENSVRNDPFKPETENCNLTYASIVARFFDADYVLVAHSGQGMARNYGDYRPGYTMVDRYDNVYDEVADSPKWDASQFRPDIVVIYLGANDFSTEKQPSLSEFASKYAQMIGKIRRNYGEDVPVLCMAPRNDPMIFDYVKTACNGIANVYYATMQWNVHNNEGDLGASWHPNYNGHRKVACEFIPYISTITGWALPEKPVK